MKWAMVLLLLLPCLGGRARAWELRVCAEANNLPYSNEAKEGFENRIARIVADEMGATLSYEWLPRPTSRYREIYLRSGRCDAVMGIADGHEAFLTSLAYYRSSYVFVYRADSGIAVESLDDPALRALRVAVGGGGRTGPERLALARRGLLENQVIFEADYSHQDPHSAPVDAVAAGRADLAIVWGPVAGFAARNASAELELVPVAPKVDRAFLPMVIPISIGVRPHDTSLRDELNLAIANRWQEIQAVLEAYDVPLEPLPQPSMGRSPVKTGSDRTSIGLVLPTPTGADPIVAAAPDAAALAAWRGAVLAEEEILRGPSIAATDLVWASAPSSQSALRAAERLADLEQVELLVGGLGEGQAAALSRVAEDNGILFFNIGSSQEALRESGSSFHLEASTEMYLEAIANAGRDAGMSDWYLVFDEPHASLLEAAVDSMENAGATIVGSSEAGQGHANVFAGIRGASPDAVLMLLGWRSQLEFLGLYDAFGLEPQLTGMPFPMTQTRTFYLALERTSVEADALRRVAVWAAGDRGQELADAYFGRWGVPMDAPAWLGYQAVSIFQQAVAATGTTDADALAAHLESEATVFDVAKGDSVRFDPDTHQLLQPLLLVHVEPDGSGSGVVEAVLRVSAP